MRLSSDRRNEVRQRESEFPHGAILGAPNTMRKGLISALKKLDRLSMDVAMELRALGGMQLRSRML